MVLYKGSPDFAAAELSSRQIRRDRYLAFAFAASDLLLELTLDGRILYAAGAFDARFGTVPEAFVGQHASRLVAPCDHRLLADVLTRIVQHGRVSAEIVRLDNQTQTPMSFSGLAMPDDEPTLCIALGPLPAVHSLAAGPAFNVPQFNPQPARLFAHTATARLRGAEIGGAADVMGLIELKGWREAVGSLPGPDRHSLLDEVSHALNRAGGPGAVTGELADGRFGVLMRGTLDLLAFGEEVRAALRGWPGAHALRVDGASLSLSAPGLTRVQASRALRYALAQFGEGGRDATDSSGFGSGLAGWIAHAHGRARGMRSAIAEGRFTLAFQPIVSLRDGAVQHYEALLRPIPTAECPIAGTQEFVLFSEAVGLAEELDLAVLEKALQALTAAPGVAVAVNVSALSMQSAPFQNTLRARLASLAPGTRQRLLIELTETAEMEDMADAAGSIAALRDAGVAVCLDDFGTGASAFRYLRDFRVDWVKIDGSFVQHAARGPQQRSLIASMVDMGRAVGAKVAAEMIETDADAALMLSLGAGFGQGWHFGRPGALPGTRARGGTNR